MKKIFVILVLVVFTACKGQVQKEEFRFLTDKELQSTSKEKLKLIRNEIFARKGYIFKSEELNTYFKTKSWYVPRSDTSLLLSDSEKGYINKIKRFENKKSSNKRCLEYVDLNVRNIYPLSGQKLKNEQFSDLIFEYESKQSKLPIEIKQIILEGSIYNLECDNDIYSLIITFRNGLIFNYLVYHLNDKIDIYKLYGDFGPYDNHQEYDFVLDHQDLEVTIEDWQRDQKISTRVEKFKLTDNGLFKL